LKFRTLKAKKGIRAAGTMDLSKKEWAVLLKKVITWYFYLAETAVSRPALTIGRQIAWLFFNDWHWGKCRVGFPNLPPKDTGADTKVKRS
jgi:hypothetical protein